MRYYYLFSDDLADGYPRVRWASDTPITDYLQKAKEEGIELREFSGDFLPERLIYDVENDCCRVPTEQEKFDLGSGKYQPPAGYYVSGRKVCVKPPQPADMRLPQFDTELGRWVDLATNEQIYLDELKRYGCARSEHALGIVSDAELAEATAYLQALAENRDATRPAWFSRYSESL